MQVAGPVARACWRVARRMGWPALLSTSAPAGSSRGATMIASKQRLRGRAATPGMLADARGAPGIGAAITATVEAAGALESPDQLSDAARCLACLSDAVCREPGCRPLASELGLPGDGMLDTRAHSWLFEYLLEKTALLSRGAFLGHGAGASETLLGHRGIGKSTTLRAFAAAAPLVCPAVIPVYINFVAGEGTASRVLLMPPLRRSVSSAGVHLPRGASLDDVVTALEAAGKFVLLLVDELDVLYSLRVQPPAGDSQPAAVETLWGLAALGDNPNGRIVTLLCGSSVVLMDLVTANGKNDDDMVRRFPLLPYAPNLNGQKFRSVRIESDPPISLAAVARINRLTAPESEWTPEQRRAVAMVAFVAGATARNAGRVWRRGPLGLRGLLGQLNVSEQWEARGTLNDTVAGPVFDAIMTRLWETNEALMGKLVDRATGTIAIDAVGSGEWAKAFRPLQIEEDRALFERVRFRGEAVPASTTLRQVAPLADRDYLSLELTNGAAVVYPYSMWTLACRRIDRAKLDTAKRGLAEAMRRMVRSVLPAGSDAVSAAMQGLGAAVGQALVRGML